jgi:hypothetical protein
LIALICCNAFFRAELGRAWPSVRDDLSKEGVSESQLAAVYLYKLLSKILQGDDLVWFKAIQILLSPHGNDSEDLFDDMEKSGWYARCEKTRFRFLELSLISSLKSDWYDDWLEKDRRDLAAAVDLKRNHITQSGVGFDQIWQRIKLSSELVDLYESVKDNLDDCTLHRASRKKNISENLMNKKQTAETLIKQCNFEKTKSNDKGEVIKKNLDSVEDEFKPRLEAVLEERTAIDFKIASLEEEKRRLKLELERVAQELVEAQSVQRDAMKYETQLRNELGSARSKISELLNKETIYQNACTIDSELTEQLVGIIRDVEKNSEIAHQESSNQLGEIYTQFDNAFVEAVQDHMVVLAESIQELFRRSKRLADELESVKRARNAQSVSSMLHSSLKESEKEEFSASAERLDVKVNDILDRLSEQANQVSQFNSMFEEFYKRFEAKLSSNRLLKGEVDKIKIVHSETERILKKYIVDIPIIPAKVPELLVEDVPDSP